MAISADDFIRRWSGIGGSEKANYQLFLTELADLARIAKSLEAAGHSPELVAGFLSRCLFTFFAEDVGLLPKRSFAELLEYLVTAPQQFVSLLHDLWAAIDEGGFAASIRQDVLRFNGKFFKQRDVIALTREQIELLLDAARADWQQVEPSIFGTLLERALDPVERHRLGAHYTPRAYVERLVLPAIIEPLRDDWKDVQAAAVMLAGSGKIKEAQAEVRVFHCKLCDVKVLDPACGSGNFLYVTLEHLKRLEGEVLNQLAELGDTQGLLELAGVTVDPHQLLGIELNPRAASIAELVLWIGYLQWHFRTRGNVMPPEPVIKDFHNIESRDAVLAYDDIERRPTRQAGATTGNAGFTRPGARGRKASVCYGHLICGRLQERQADCAKAGVGTIMPMKGFMNATRVMPERTYQHQTG